MTRISKALVNEVVKRTKEKRRPLRTKRTLVLTKETYERFENACKKIDRYPSEVVDEFISMFVEDRG